VEESRRDLVDHETLEEGGEEEQEVGVAAAVGLAYYVVLVAVEEAVVVFVGTLDVEQGLFDHLHVKSLLQCEE
jgi:hypothetical protein